MLFVDNIHNFKKAAIERDVPESETAKYRETLPGLIIKQTKDDKNFLILLRKDFPEEEKERTITTLRNQEIEPPLDLFSQKNEYFHAFVLLHEIAHFILSHGSTNEKEEKEANKWATFEFPNTLEIIRKEPNELE